MNNLIIKESTTTPEVIFEASKGKFYLAGRSYPENVNEFYQPLYIYIEEYIRNPLKNTVLSFRWFYYNSATAQIIVHLIMSLHEVCENLVVKWYCDKNFDLMIEKGNELKELLDVNLEIIH